MKINGKTPPEEVDMFDELFEGYEPETIKECRFDQIMKFRKDRNEHLSDEDITLLNEKIRNEWESLMESTMNSVALANAGVEVYSEMKDALENEGSPYAQVLTDDGYTLDQVNVMLENEKHNQTSTQHFYSASLNDLFKRVSLVQQCNDSPLSARMREDGQPVKIVTDETIEMLGDEYKKFAGYYNFMKPARLREKPDREIPTVYDGPDDDLTFKFNM